MKQILITLLALTPCTVLADYQHRQSTDATRWTEMQRYVFDTHQTIPLELMHRGEAASYQIVVNGSVISEPFTLEGVESIGLDVPITLEDRAGTQSIKLCSQSVSDESTVGAKVCNVVEFTLLKGK